MQSAIEVRALRKRFDVVDAVKGVDFSVARGEVLGFLGPNGAGKSTTMKMVTGYIPATSGTVSICGHDVAHDPIKAKQHLGYLPEGAPLYGEMTPVSFLKFTGAIRRMSGADLSRRMGEVMADLQLEGVRHQRIDTLSKGFRRRVGLAQAILHDPDVLILDEPTDGLDPNQKRQVRQLIRNLAPTKSIIISTHLLEEVDAVCDRVLILDKGRIVLEGTPDDLHARAEGHNTVVVLVHRPDTAKSTSALAGLPDVEVTHADEGEITRISVRPKRRQPVAETVSGALRDAGVQILEIRTERGSLDEVFRSVTAAPVSMSVSQ
ncbi:ABC transporter ATP-binding protein [Paradevosia shaoguanensis]|uniref:ABC transporter ATP-binding protein n=1 Tax=Paradevosia shaoguanensis TaxID=1335043 RepID=UPI0019330DC3|nr:ABC transporter ATP-binding protein [Paradevosia shaoguanensis]